MVCELQPRHAAAATAAAAAAAGGQVRACCCFEHSLLSELVALLSWWLYKTHTHTHTQASPLSCSPGLGPVCPGETVCHTAPGNGCEMAKEDLLCFHMSEKKNK